LAPLKTTTSRRTIEITRALAAELALASAGQRVFEHLTHDVVDKAWQRARKGLAEPAPVIHDLRHTHVSGLIADGWDPVEVAQRIGDTLATTLQVTPTSSTRAAAARSDARRSRPATTPGWQPTDRSRRQQTRPALPPNPSICRLFAT
jgi:integrase